MLAGELGEGLRREILASPERPDYESLQSVVEGKTTTIEGERTHVRTVGVYETEAEIDLDGIETATRDGLKEEWELAAVYQNGRAVISERVFPTDDFSI